MVKKSTTRSPQNSCTYHNQVLVNDDSLNWMRSQPDESFDVVVADPPYCSATRGSTCKQSSATKYTTTGAARQFKSFDGDNRDQRGFQLWTSIWTGEALRLTRDGGALLVFIDYRNLSAMIDAVQAGGWVFDGVVPWVKTHSRCRLGWYQTSHTEFVVACRKGNHDRSHRVCGPKSLGGMAPQKRMHPTQKPTSIICELVRFRSDWQRILDPFAGSGTTLIAAMELGRSATGIESNHHYYDLAKERLESQTLAA